MKLIYAGVDTLALAFKCSVPAPLIAALSKAKEGAAANRHPHPITVGVGDVVWVPDHGLPGGFGLVMDTGPTGELWAFKRDCDRIDWNLYVKPHAFAFLAHGYGEVVMKILARLEALKIHVVEQRVSRIDYAMDFRADDFALSLDQFVAHPRMKKAPNWSSDSRADADYGLASVLRGKRLESVTIGKMPGRQIIVYDKIAEIRSTKKPVWFEAWGIDPDDATVRVTRLEVRAGRNALRGAPKICVLADLETKLRPLLLEMLSQVRYLAPDQSDANVSRRKLHEIWRLAVDHISSANLLPVDGVIPHVRILELTLDMKIEQYEKLLRGLAAGWAAAVGLTDEQVAENLSRHIAEIIDAGIEKHPRIFECSLQRARTRLAPFHRSPLTSDNSGDQK